MADGDVEEREMLDDAENLLSDSLASETFEVEKSGKKRWTALVYLQCYFVTIAVILGPGILGLPVKLSQSGFAPFVVVFSIGFLFQVLVVFYFVDLLQRSYVIRQEELRNAACSADEDIPLHDVEDDPEEEEEEDGKLEKEVELNRNGDASGLPSIRTEGFGAHMSDSYPTLHTLAELFLDNGVRQLFETLVLLMFVSTLISHALAGSEAYAQLLNLNTLYIIPVFVWCCAFLILFLQSCVLPLVSLLTFLGGSLILTATVCVAVFTGSKVGHEVHTDFRHIGQPFVMGAVAMGGIVNILPLLFAKIKPSPAQIRGFCQSITAGLLTCTCLILFWCYAVLEVVPQEDCFAGRNTSHQASSLPYKVCLHNESLQWAEERGEMSVVPLVNILKADYPDLSWVTIAVQVFVTVSITVSFLTMGAGMKHMVESWFDSFYSTSQSNWQEVKSKWEGLYCKANLRWFVKCAALLSLFGFVFAVAVLNPKGAVTVLRNVTSLVLNVESSIFILLMLRRSYHHKFRHLRVPVPLLRLLYHLQYFVIIYFLVAVGCNIAEIVHTASYNQTSLPSRIDDVVASQNLTALNYTMGSNSSEADLHNRRWRVFDTLSNNTVNNTAS